MLEESARVIAAANGFAVVETQRRSTCESCSAQKGCGTAALGKSLGRRPAQVRALNRADAGIGDHVVVGIAEDALLRGSLAIYLVPLLLMLAGASLGQRVSLGLSLPGEGLSVLSGVGGLALGFAWSMLFSRAVRHDGRYRPVVLRCIAKAAGIPKKEAL